MPTAFVMSQFCNLPTGATNWPLFRMLPSPPPSLLPPKSPSGQRWSHFTQEDTVSSEGPFLDQDLNSGQKVCPSCLWPSAGLTQGVMQPLSRCVRGAPWVPKQAKSLFAWGSHSGKHKIGKLPVVGSTRNKNRRAAWGGMKFCYFMCRYPGGPLRGGAIGAET